MLNQNLNYFENLLNVPTMVDIYFQEIVQILGSKILPHKCQSSLEIITFVLPAWLEY